MNYLKSYIAQDILKHSKRTTSEYKRTLQIFFALMERIPLENIIQNYITKIPTLRQLKAALVSYNKYLKRVNQVEHKKITDTIEYIQDQLEQTKYKSRVLEILNAEEQELLKEQFDNYILLGHSYEMAIPFMAMALMLYAGLRRSEVVSLTRHSFTTMLLREKKQKEIINIIKFIGKGNKERKVPMYILLQYIKQFIKVLLPATNDHLFTDDVGDPLNGRQLYYRVMQAQKQIGIRHVKLHAFRHTFATNIIEKEGVDTVTLQALMGHSSPNSTAIYTHISMRKMYEAIKK